MDLAVLVELFWTLLLTTKPDSSNPEHCVNKHCVYVETRQSPLQFTINCKSELEAEELRKMLKCLESSWNKTKYYVEFAFSTQPNQPIFINDNFDGLEIMSLDLSDLDNPNTKDKADADTKILKTLRLSDEKLTQIPTSVKSSKTLSDLWIENQKLEVIPDFTFQEMSSLKRLVLWSNSIYQIGQFAFMGLDKLDDLRLYGNNLTCVPNEAIRNMTSLKNLDLGFNKISELKPNDFTGLTSLQELQLNGNRLKLIHEDAFADLHELRVIDLSRVELTSVPIEALRKLPKLKWLFLGRNNITNWGANQYHGLNSLEWLWLLGNKFVSIHEDAFAGLHKLTELNLNECNLTSVPIHALKSLSKLEKLYMGDNNITELKNNDFWGLSSLSNLYLATNEISSIDVDAFAGLEESLTHLNLHGNQLTKIPVKALQNLTKLKSVAFGNLIEFIEPDTFQHFGKLIEQINLSENRIRSFPKSAFHHLPSLKEILLMGNQLHHLEFTVFHPILNTANSFWTTDNPLECSCDLYWHFEFNANHLHNLGSTWFSKHQAKHKLGQGQCKRNETIINLEEECKQEWKPVMCNASSVYGCMVGQFCNDVSGCKDATINLVTDEKE